MYVTLVMWYLLTMSSSARKHGEHPRELLHFYSHIFLEGLGFVAVISNNLNHNNMQVKNMFV